ncbi:hypothetical protein F5X97DRAFT_105775 [Nemania serpens]|nr:hypothetical protein F5X97DRAFT_105775 [Nemania serpens]
MSHSVVYASVVFAAFAVGVHNHQLPHVSIHVDHPRSLLGRRIPYQAHQVWKGVFATGLLLPEVKVYIIEHVTPKPDIKDLKLATESSQLILFETPFTRRRRLLIGGTGPNSG